MHTNDIQNDLKYIWSFCVVIFEVRVQQVETSEKKWEPNKIGIEWK